MNKSNLALGISIGLIVLAAVSCFVEISAQVLTALSISSLLFTASQTMHSFLATKSEENQKIFEMFKSAGQIQLDEKWDLFYKNYLDLWSNGKKEKTIKVVGNILEIIACTILIVGLAVPIKIFNDAWIGELCTYLSFGILFLSIWIMEFSRRKIKLWGELQVFSILFKDNTAVEDDGGNENG